MWTCIDFTSFSFFWYMELACELVQEFYITLCKRMGLVVKEELVQDFTNFYINLVYNSVGQRLCGTTRNRR